MSSDSVERNWLRHTRAQVRKFFGWVKRRVAASIGGVPIARADEVLGRFNGRFASLACDRLRRSLPESHERLMSIVSDAQGFLARMTAILNQSCRETRQWLTSISAWSRKNAVRLWFALRVIVSRRDTKIAVVALFLIRSISHLLPQVTTRSFLWSAGIFALSISMGLATICIVRVGSYLSKTADYESLRAHDEPNLPGGFLAKPTRFVEEYPFTVVVFFSTIAGIILSLDAIPVGTAIRQTLNPVESLAPSPVREILTWPIREWEQFLQSHFSTAGSDDSSILADVRWYWTCFHALVLFFQGTLIIALGAAWLKRFWERHALSSLLVSDPNLPGLPLRETARGRVMTDRARRTGCAILSHLWSELADPALSSARLDPAGADRCRYAVVALEEIFDKTNVANAWSQEPKVSTRLLHWLRGHTETLLKFDRHLDTRDDHRLAESVVALATMAGGTMPQLDGKLSHSELESLKDAANCDVLLSTVFDRSGDRPIVLVAACEAAVRVETPESSSLLENLTRNLDKSTKFRPSETDRILLAHDRVLNKPKWRESERDRAIRFATKKLGFKHIKSADGMFERFLRPKDGATMVLVPAGSFIRGDERATSMSSRFKRRVHVDAYLIDTHCVTDDAFNRWVHGHPRILDLDRGFIETCPDDLHWFAATYYAEWVADEGRGRLPTEAQWEKAARGPIGERRFPGGDDLNCSETRFVSPYGVYIGDALEWTADGFDEAAYGSVDHDFPKSGLHNPYLEAREQEGATVVRGGYTNSGAPYSLAERTGLHPLTGGIERRIRFRVVIAIPPKYSGANR